MEPHEERNWSEAVAALTAICEWLERAAIPLGIVDRVSQWEAFLRRAWPVIGRATSARSPAEMRRAAAAVVRLLEEQPVGATVTAWLRTLSPDGAPYFTSAREPGITAPAARTARTLLPEHEASVRAIMRAIQATAQVGDAGGGDAPTLAPRYANVALVEAASPQLLPRDRPILPGAEVRLRLDIGALSADSAVDHPVPIPERLLPSQDLPIDVVVSSGQFLVAATAARTAAQRQATGRLILPRGGGPATTDQGEPFLYFFLRAPSRESVARARINYYYRNHLVQSQSLRADIGRGLGGYQVEVDYTLSRSLNGLEALPARSQVSIFTEEAVKTVHRLVLRTSGAAGQPLGEPSSYEIDEYAVGHLISGIRDVLRRTGVAPVRKRRRKDQLVRDLRHLAPLGWQLWNAVVAPRFHDVYDVLDRFEGVVLQVSRPATASYAFPWGLVYDIPQVSGEEPRVCPLVEAWDEVTDLVSQGVRRCPRAPDGHPENTLCPFGFWGYRYPIEQLSSTDSAVTEIRVPRTETFHVVSVETERGVDEDRLSEHVAALRQLLQKRFPAATLRRARNRLAARELLGADTPLVYFYCHGERPGISTPGVPSAIRQEQTYLGIDGNETLTPTDISAWVLQWRRDEGRRVWDRTRPLVFVNACHSAEINPDTLVSYLDAFVGTANAAGLIGTEVRVDQDLAMDVAVQFFTRFIQGWTVDAALHAVRLNYLAQGNLLGLVYTPYCMADLSLVAVD